MFSNGRDMTKCHSFCTTTLTKKNADAKATAIPPVFFENSQARNVKVQGEITVGPFGVDN